MLLTKNEMENQLVGALEGGSNYWYMLGDLSHVKRTKGEPLSTELFKAIYADKKLEIRVLDCESDEDELLGILSYANLKRADDLLKTEQYKWVLSDIKGERDDASTADVWFQLVVMGEIVYG